jgi:superfamily II DNA or RNA helicase
MMSSADKPSRVGQQVKPSLDLYFGSASIPIAGLGPGSGARFVETYFPMAQHTLRIATAYFSIQAYNSSRKYLAPHAQVHVLVGSREGENVSEAVLEEIRYELRHTTMDLYDAVVDLVQRMRAGLFRIRDAREMKTRFHCKFYICDDIALFHGSANFSVNGLENQSEQVQAIHDSDQIRQWRDWYDAAAGEARDLLAEILEELEKWLQLAAPFDVYLKTILLLFGLPDATYHHSAHVPVYYQQAIVAWALRQLESCGGALAIVGTGLGKTVIGAEVAGRLYATEEVKRVVVIAPNSVQTDWKKELNGRRVPAEIFGNNTLFSAPSRIPHHQAYRLDQQLEHAGPDTLIVIDEAHAYRNQLLARSFKGHSRVLNRLTAATARGAKILLLTGSAYGTSIQNLNSLLYLLPHRCLNALGELGPWRVSTHSEFGKLRPVCVLGVPHVMEMARQRGNIDEFGRPFIPFADGDRFLPRLLHSEWVLYTLPLWHELRDAFDHRCFDQARKVPTLRYDDERGECKSVTDTVYNVTLESWLSSPDALLHSIDQNLATKGGKPQVDFAFNRVGAVVAGANQPALFPELMQSESKRRASRFIKHLKHCNGYRTRMHQDPQIRADRLDTLRERLHSGVPDQKLLLLTQILRGRCLNERAKAIIFVQMYPTALYLQEKLRRIFRNRLKVACTVTKAKHAPRLKPSQARMQLLRQFSPRSHSYLMQDAETDVLICTDADGVGVNLQDADTVINYDMPHAADVLVQRLGRVIRPTDDPHRIPRMYTFVPSCIEDLQTDSGVQTHIRQLYLRLLYRHLKSSEILGSRVVGDGETASIPLDGDVPIEDLLRHFEVPGGMSDDMSVASHIAILEQFRTRAESLRHIMHSARYCPIEHPHAFVFIKSEDRYYPVLFDLKSDKIANVSELAALNLIRCDVEEPRAGVAVRDVHRAADRAITTWCEQQRCNASEVERVCVLYLQPADRISDLDALLSIK